jgi:NADPH-dependent 2,4-dienoyl-CoA reductase/sulfur reductase-like enzyme
MNRYRYLIIGGGMTADAAAHGIRELDLEGTLGIIGAEGHGPYNRPPLSKGLWKGEAEAAIWRDTATTNAEMHLGRRVVGIDPVAKRVTDDAGVDYTYEKLLLATGGSPRRLRLDSEQVIYYRTVDDYRRLRRLAGERLRFAVLGGGFIGTEIAAALRMQDRDVVMLVPGEGLAERVLPSDLSSFLVDYYRDKGVEMRMGEGLASLRQRAGRAVIATTADREVEADVLVAGLGIRPNVELAEQADLIVENGVVVDQFLRTSDPDIYAAGDVANFPNPALGIRTRVEHEDNSNTMGRHAGRNMAGEAAPYHHLPFFYSDLFELGYEAVGDLDARHETVADWKERFREGVVYYLKDGRVRGVLLWNVWGQVDAARQLIAEPDPVTPSALKGRL